MWRQTVALLSICCGRSTRVLLRLGACTGSVVKLQWWELWLLCIFLLSLAGTTDEREAVLFCLLRRESVALAMLPNVASVACYAVGAIVHVLAVLATNRAIKIPGPIFLGQFLELLLELFLLILALAPGRALRLCGIVLVFNTL